MPQRNKRVKASIANLRKVNMKRQQRKKGAYKPELPQEDKMPADPVHKAQEAQVHMWKTFQEITTDTWVPSEFTKQ